MTDYASRELCQELYEATGWGIGRTDRLWRVHKPSGLSKLVWTEEQKADDYRFRNSPEATRFRQENEFYPAYTIGYLLDKLSYVRLQSSQSGWDATFRGDDDNWISKHANTPANALAKLAIELHKQGLLK